MTTERDDTMTSRRTKRRYAHELFPHPDETWLPHAGSHKNGDRPSSSRAVPHPHITFPLPGETFSMSTTTVPVLAQASSWDDVFAGIGGAA